MIETDHQKFVDLLLISIMVGPRLFLVKSLKGDWDQKCFQDNKNFEIVIYRISFTFHLQNFSWF